MGLGLGFRGWDGPLISGRHMPVAFINLEKCEEKREGHGSSYINPAEAPGKGVFRV